MSKATQYAWAAGTIDADGCVHLSKNGSSYAERIVITTTHSPENDLRNMNVAVDSHSTNGCGT